MKTPNEIAEMFVDDPTMQKALAACIVERDIQFILDERSFAQEQMAKFRDLIRKVLDEKKLSWWNSSIVPSLIDEIREEIGLPELD